MGQIRNSRLLTSVVAVGVLILAVYLARWSALSVGSSPYASLIGETVLGTVILIGGRILFGCTAMGLIPDISFFQRAQYSLIPLTAMLLLNSFGTPISELDFSRLDITKDVVTGFWEEVLFRSFLFGTWVRLFGFRTIVSRLLVITVTSLLFGVAHNNHGTELFLRFGLGLMLAMVFIKTHSLVYVVILHAFNNSLSSVMGGNVDETVKVAVFTVLILFSTVIILKVTDYPGMGLANARNQNLSQEYAVHAD